MPDATHVDKVLVGKVEELVKLNSAVRVLAELTLALQLGGLGGVSELGVGLR